MPRFRQRAEKSKGIKGLGAEGERQHFHSSRLNPTHSTPNSLTPFESSQCLLGSAETPSRPRPHRNTRRYVGVIGRVIVWWADEGVLVGRRLAPGFDIARAHCWRCVIRGRIFVLVDLRQVIIGKFLFRPPKRMKLTSRRTASRLATARRRSSCEISRSIFENEHFIDNGTVRASLARSSTASSRRADSTRSTRRRPSTKVTSHINLLRRPPH